MWPVLVVAALTLPSDTLTVRPGEVVVLAGVTNDVLVEGTGGDRAELVDGSDSWTLVRIGNRIELRAARGVDYPESIHLRIPRGAALRIDGVDAEVVVDGIAGGVEVDLMTGDVTLRDVAGSVRVGGLSGDLILDGGVGDVTMTTLEGSIEVRRVRGDVSLDTTDGDLTLIDVVGSNVQARTVDGDVVFDGVPAERGTLILTTHDGAVTARVPAELSASIEIETFDGNFESAFPVRVNGLASNRALQFEVGGGGSRVVLRSFDGDIRLLHR